MAQAYEFHTYQLYQRFHKLIHASDDVQTYMHFGAIARTNAPSQTEVLPGYMKAMIESIINDINQFGDCWLLQAILGHQLPAVHVLDHSAVIYVHASVFTPDDRPRLTNKWIPFTGMFSESVGGLQYADPKAYSLTMDIRSESLLHHQARALQLYAQQKALQRQLTAFADERNALNSQITSLKDELFGLRRELESTRHALHDTASTACEQERQAIMEAARTEAGQLLASARAALDEALAEKRRERDAALTDALQQRMALQLDDFGAAFGRFRSSLLQELTDLSAAMREPDAEKPGL